MLETASSGTDLATGTSLLVVPLAFTSFATSWECSGLFRPSGGFSEELDEEDDPFVFSIASK
jgi:hypothetical protein